MKYKLEDFIRVDSWNGSLRMVDVVQECQVLGDALTNLVQALEKADPEHAILKDPDVSYRVKLMRDREQKERKAAEKKLANAKARKQALDKLTREEQIAFGIIKA
jgi:hypothetical protein